MLTQCACSDSVRMSLPCSYKLWSVTFEAEDNAEILDCRPVPTKHPSEEETDLLAVPQLDCPVARSGVDNTFAAPPHCVDRSRVSSESEFELAQLRVPDADGTVFRGRGDPRRRGVPVKTGSLVSPTNARG